MTIARYRVSAGRHDRLATPLLLPAVPGDQPHLSLSDDTGLIWPAQRTTVGGQTTVQTIVPAMQAGDVRLVDLVSIQETGDAGDGVTLHEGTSGIDVRIGGNLLTTYVFAGDGLARPYCAPLHGPGGLQFTRQFPMVPDVPGETRDHPHHRSLWVAYGDVNDVDNWSEQARHGFTRHEAFEQLFSGPVLGGFTARSRWTDTDGQTLLVERRSMTFYRQPDTGRCIDLTVHWEAGAVPVTFGDTKEGGIVSVRVASSMDGKRGGEIANSYGGRGEAETWGRRAEWCDYSGVVEGRTVGITIFDHPANFRAPTYWHVRDYGLMTTNVFGGESFTGDPARNGRYTLPANAGLTFRYRLYLHSGDSRAAAVGERFHDFITPPTVESA